MSRGYEARGVRHVASCRLERLDDSVLDLTSVLSYVREIRDHEGTTFTVTEPEFRGTCHPSLAAVTPVPVTV